MKARLPAIPLALVFATSLAAAGGPSAPQVVVTRLDGATLTGALEGLDATGFHLATPAGSETLAVDDVTRVEFLGVSVAGETEAADWVFYLSGGGRLAGVLERGGPEKIVARTQIGVAAEFTFSQLAAVERRVAASAGEAKAFFDAARNERLPGRDVLIARDAETVKALRGTLLELGPQTSEFVFNGRPRRLPTEKIYGVVLAASADEPAPATVHLRGGDELTAALEGADAHALQVRVAGGSYGIPFDRLVSLDLRSPRVVYLSDLTPVAHTADGWVQHEAPYRRDRNVFNGPLTLDGTAYAKGLGMRARCTLVYELDRPYEALAATIGIDDAVRPGGSVEFVVLADGEQVFASGPLSGADRPRDILVPLTGVSLVTLVVDFAANADVGDWANWAAARLIKSKETRW